MHVDGMFLITRFSLHLNMCAAGAKLIIHWLIFTHWRINVDATWHLDNSNNAILFIMLTFLLHLFGGNIAYVDYFTDSIWPY